MRLTQWTDYSLRVLMYCAACQERVKPPTVAEIAEAHGISRSHLMKIVMSLASYGWLERPADGEADCDCSSPPVSCVWAMSFAGRSLT